MTEKSSDKNCMEEIQVREGKVSPTIGNEDEMISDLKLIETENIKIMPHSARARLYVTKFLLISIISIVGIPLVTLLASIVFGWSVDSADKMVEFAKWAVQVLAPLLGAAIGFYFGGGGKHY